MEIKLEVFDKISGYIGSELGLNSKVVLNLLSKPKDIEHGDIALPCFLVGKELGKNPATLAQELSILSNPPSLVKEMKAVGPFLNFKLNLEELAESLLLSNSNSNPFPSNNENIIVEYSSPNIAKPFHVGHLRATLIGNALDRIYNFTGYEVDSINHLGDWGTQFGFVYAGCKIWGYPESYSVSSLVELYKKATGLKESQEKDGIKNGEEDVNDLARAYFIDLEEGKEYALEFWQKCVDASLEYLKNTYERMHIKFDHYLGESFYSNKMGPVQKGLEEQNLLIESQGALGVDLGEKLGFARLFTPDGRSLYLTRDLAAAEYRYNEFNFTKSIYVVGAPQTLHFQQIKEILVKLNKPYAKDIVHVAFGHVLGMKTRGDGKSIELNEFLDEAERLALEAYRTGVEKRPEGLDEIEVSKKVALAAIIFSTLNRTNIKDVTFKWEDALSFQGDSGPYLLYAYARLKGIEERAKKEGLTGVSPFDFSSIDTEGARALILTILDFESTLRDTIKDNEPLILCQYALSLSKAISKAYLDLKVLGTDPKVGNTRLALFNKSREVLRVSLELLGIDVLERM